MTDRVPFKPGDKIKFQITGRSPEVRRGGQLMYPGSTQLDVIVVELNGQSISPTPSTFLYSHTDWGEHENEWQDGHDPDTSYYFTVTLRAPIKTGFGTDAGSSIKADSLFFDISTFRQTKDEVPAPVDVISRPNYVTRTWIENALARLVR
jgi:hypothetical protein